MINNNYRFLVYSSLIAAFYAAFTFLIAPLSFGVFQFRLSEAFTILPLFTPYAVLGLTVGCFISNLIGFFMGQTPIFDMLFGTMATFLAAFCTYSIRKISFKPLKYILAPLFSVVFNSLILGIQLTLFYGGLLWLNILVIGVGESVACFIFGGFLIYILNNNDFYKKIFK